MSIDKNTIKKNDPVIRGRGAESFRSGFSLTREKEEKTTEDTEEGGSWESGFEDGDILEWERVSRSWVLCTFTFLCLEHCPPSYLHGSPPYPFKCHLLSEVFQDRVCEIAILPQTARPGSLMPLTLFYFSLFLFNSSSFGIYLLFVCFNLSFLFPQLTRMSECHLHESLSVLLMAKSPAPRIVPYTPWELYKH